MNQGLTCSNYRLDFGRILKRFVTTDPVRSNKMLSSSSSNFNSVNVFIYIPCFKRNICNLLQYSQKKIVYSNLTSTLTSKNYACVTK